MTEFERNVTDQVVGIGKSHIPEDERDVLRVLYERFKNKDGKITQRELAIALPHLGKHRRDKAPTEETTLRRVRQIIRDLRVLRWAPIISDGDGYFLPTTEAQARAYMDRIEIEVRARAAAGYETYRAMKESLGISSEYLDGQEKLLEQPIKGTADSASQPGLRYDLYHVAGQGWICTCPSFNYRGRCRHAAAKSTGAG